MDHSTDFYKLRSIFHHYALVFSKVFVRDSGGAQIVECLLQFVQEMCGLPAIHLSVMKLKRNRKSGLEQMTFVFAPSQKGVVEDACILVDDGIQFGRQYRRGTDDHGVVDGGAGGGVVSRLRQGVVVGVELFLVVGIGNVTRTDTTVFVIHNHIDGKAVELEQFSVYGQQVEFG